MPTPEDKAHDPIDLAFEKSGSQLQDTKPTKLNVAPDIARQNFLLATGYGFEDYLLYIDGKAAWETEDKKEGGTLAGVEVQAAIREQRQIMAEVERRLSVIEELETTIETNLTRAERFRQSVLGNVFSGNLLLRGVRV